MVFSSISFLYIFLPLMILVYFILPNKLKNLSLLIGSLAFYVFDNYRLLFLLIPSIIIAYINGILIDKFHKKIHFILSIFLALSPLIYFKYTNFFIENANNLLGFNIKLLHLVLPLGISFYTFQIISYLSDVWTKKCTHSTNFINLALYVSCFPQLIAGPIVKYEDFSYQLNHKEISIKKFESGIFSFVIGLSQKVLLANQLGEFCKYYVARESTILFTWVYVVAYSLQIYFDFNGYSLMAIGLGRMFGFEFPRNFNYPFMAKSIKDFWKRWHMTLSSFFKEYVYIPLGGSRCNNLKYIRNLFIVWILTGFWHGANWNFIIWGLFFFCLLLIEKFIVKEKLNKYIQRFLTLILIGISFLIFSEENLMSLFISLKGLVSGEFINEYSLFFIRDYIGILIISIIGATPLLKNIYNKYLKEKKVSFILEPFFIVGMMLLCTAYLIDGSFNPFLYFRF